MTSVLRTLSALFEALKPERLDGVGLKRDDKGWYIQTHRARSKSYPDVDDIPDSVVEFIRSTG